MSKWLRITITIAVLACLGIVTAIGAAPAPTKIVVMLFNTELTPDHIKLFELRNTDIKIERIDYDNNKMQAMIAAGTPPNIIRSTNSNLPSLVSRGFMQEITPWLTKSKILRISDFDQIYNAYRYDPKTMKQGVGGYWGVMKDYSLVFDTWYRNDIFKECGVAAPSTTEPMTYDQFYEIAKKLTERTGDRTLRWGAGGCFAFVDLFLEQCLKSVGSKSSLYSRDMKKVVLTGNPEVVKAAKWLLKMYKERLVPSPIDPASDWDVPLLIAGRQAMYQFGYWAGASFAEGGLTDPNKLGYFPTPKWGKNWVNTAAGCVGMFMLKSKSQAEMNASWRLMEFFGAQEPAMERAKTGTGLTPLKSLQKYIPQESPVDKLRYEVTMNQMKNVYPSVANPYRNVLGSIWSKYLEDVLKGKITEDAFLAKVEQECNQALADAVATAGQ